MGISLSKLLLEVLKKQTIMAYHGSPQKITNFTDEFVGGEGATDQEGPGIYFTTNYKEALGYADGGYVYTAKLTPRLLFDETEDINIEKRLIERLVLMSSDWKSTGRDWDENPRVGIKAGTTEVRDREIILLFRKLDL